MNDDILKMIQGGTHVSVRAVESHIGWLNTAIVHYVQISDLGRIARCCRSWNDFCVEEWLKPIYFRTFNQAAELKSVLKGIQSSIMASECNGLSGFDKIERLLGAEKSFSALIRYTVWGREFLRNSFGSFDLEIQSACLLFLDKPHRSHVGSAWSNNILLLEQRGEWIGAMQPWIIKDCLRTINESVMWLICKRQDFMQQNYLFLLKKFILRISSQNPSKILPCYLDEVKFIKEVLYSLTVIPNLSKEVQLQVVELLSLLAIGSRHVFNAIKHAFHYPDLCEEARAGLIRIIEVLMKSNDVSIAAKAKLAKGRYGSY